MGTWKGVREAEEARVSQEVGGRREILATEGHDDATAAGAGSMAAEVWDTCGGVELLRCRSLSDYIRRLGTITTIITKSINTTSTTVLIKYGEIYLDVAHRHFLPKIS